MEDIMKTVFILLFLCMAALLPAQEIGLWSNIRHSSYTIDNELHIRSELVSLPDSYTEFYFSQGSGWLQRELSLLEGMTHEAVIPVDPEEMVLCRYRTVMPLDFDEFGDIIPDLPDSLIAMMPGYLPEDDFPPQMEDMAFVAEDLIGDIPADMPDYLDITAQYFSFSDSRFYTAISNNDTDFPTGPVMGPFNVYASLIINPETAVTDSVFYALVYGQIPVLLNPGLYRFSDMSIDGFQRIGDIEYHISGSDLIKACSIDDLTSDPHFGDWPNMTNSLIFIPITMRLTITMEIELVDNGQVSQLIFEQYMIEPFNNILPELSGVNVEHAVNLTTIDLVYYDANGNFPLISEVVIDDEQTYQFQPLSLDFNAPVNFSVTFAGEWSSGQIYFSDNGYEMVEHPVYLSADEISAPGVSDLSVSVYPNPFSPSRADRDLKIMVDSPSRGVEHILEIYDIRGRKVKSLTGTALDGDQATYYWDGRASQGKQVTSGLYFLRVIDVQTNRKAFNKVLVIR